MRRKRDDETDGDYLHEMSCNTVKDWGCMFLAAILITSVYNLWSLFT